LHHEVFLDYEVNAYFYPNESWYKPELCDANTLAHEQLHFDISELFARKMRNRLDRTSFSDDVKAEVRKIFKDILDELKDFQARYDMETNYSRNRGKQAEWDLAITEALAGEK
jgi:predicted secreted Zn-dependent protease